MLPGGMTRLGRVGQGSNPCTPTNIASSITWSPVLCECEDTPGYAGKVFTVTRRPSKSK